MKKSLLVLALTAVFALSFSAVAQAKYAGFEGATAADTSNGYVTWTAAQTVMTAAGVPAAAQTTPHGGYTSTTTKCAVCHSTHRAASDMTASGVGSYWKLTPGGQSCVACHTPHGSNPVATALVEWPANYADGGPHRSQNCLGSCHGSVHGSNGSEYAAVSMWNLTGANDVSIAAAFAAGNEYTAQDVIDTDAADRTRGTITEQAFRDYTLPAVGSASRQAFTTARSMRAMATGYTCNSSDGCHRESTFTVNKPGYAELRPADKNLMSDTAITGHLTNMTYGCPPCHMEYTGLEGDPTADPSGALLANQGKESQCSQCHDAIGKATNSNAFPHANRSITMLERQDGGAYTDLVVSADSENLWMYSGDATKRDASGMPSATGLMNTSRSLVESASTNINDGTCLKCHAFEQGQHAGVPNTYLNSDGTARTNVLDFSTF